MTWCSSWPAFVQAAIHASGSTVLDAASLVPNHIAFYAVKAPGEEQFPNIAADSGRGETEQCPFDG
jgi:hypothetical protein